MMQSPELTLKEIQLRLGEEQHRLIHLCEKGVIEPDFEETSGRGKWRRFSKRNVFEFALALTLRKYEIPVSSVAALMKLLRSFQRSIGEYRIPEALNKVQMDLRIYDGEYVVFSLNCKVNIGFNMKRLLSGDVKNVRAEKLKKLPSEYVSELRVDLSKIAKQFV